MFVLYVIALFLRLSTSQVYLNNQSAVDEVVSKVMVQVEEVKGKVVDVLPASLRPAVVVVKKEE